MTTRMLPIVIAVLAAGAWGGQNRPTISPTPPVTPIARSGPVDEARLDRLERWLKAVDQHVPGARDDVLLEVGEWSNADLRFLWIDVNVIVQLIRNPRLNRFNIRAEGESGSTAVSYAAQQVRRLQRLACAAAGGLVSHPHCLAIDAANAVDADLRRLSTHALAATLRDGANYVMRRGALLHTDVVLLAPPPPSEPVSGAASIVPQRIRMQIADGQERGVRQSPVHWEIARMVLDDVQPRNVVGPARSKDEMVRQWYRATASWMQSAEEHDTFHLERGRQIFPDDPDLAFLAGCQHETYGAPAIQAAMRSAVVPSGFTLEVGNDRTELRAAENLFRRALTLRPDFPEAQLRLGRVLAMLGRHDDAARELAQAAASVDNAQLRFYAALFLGAEEEALGRYDAARDAYEHAAAIYPTAQSPYLALSGLARRRGDRASALRALQEMFDLPPTEPERDDPWWQYHVAQARNVAELLDAVRQSFLPEPQR